MIAFAVTATTASAGDIVIAPTDLNWDGSDGFTNQTGQNGLNGNGLSDATIVETGDPIPAVWPQHSVWGNNGLAGITDIATRTTNAGTPGPVTRQVTMDFDETFLFDGIALWNWSSSFQNGSGVIPNDQGRGIDFASIEFSTDGENFTQFDLNGDTVIDALDVVSFSIVPENPQTPGVAPDYDAEVVSFGGTMFEASTIRLTATNFGAGSIIGIGEIRFTGFVAETDLIGDYNGDDAVTAADYSVWRDSVGSTNGLPGRDTANIGDIGLADYDSWQANFGETQTSGLIAAGSSVPEPAAAALMLAVVGVGGVLERRRS